MARPRSLTTPRTGCVPDGKAGSVQTMYNGFIGKSVIVVAEVAHHKIPNIPMTCSLQNPFPLLVHVTGNKVKSIYKACISMLLSNTVKISNAFCSFL